MLEFLKKRNFVCDGEMPQTAEKFPYSSRHASVKENSRTKKPHIRSPGQLCPSWRHRLSATDL